MAQPAAPPAEVGRPGGTMVLERPPRTVTWLVVRSGGEPGQIFELTGERTTVGSAIDSGIRLDHPSVSSSHAQIVKKEGNYLLYDMGSTNGSWINDNEVAGALLREDSRIIIGGSELVFARIADEDDRAEGIRAIIERIIDSIKGLISSLTGGADESPESEEPIMRDVIDVRSGPSEGKRIDIGEDDLVLGRQPGEQGAQIDDPTVSQRHALLRPTPEGCLIFDLASANGTMVDDVSLRGVLLHNGELVKFGEAELQFVHQETV